MIEGLWCILYTFNFNELRWFKVKDVTKELLKEKSYILYIYTPFCGTCHLANSMLKQIEMAHDEQIFYKMNASLYPEFMQKEQIESVPCLLIKQNNEIKEKIYTFYSVPNIYTYLIKYQPDLFISKS